MESELAAFAQTLQERYGRRPKKKGRATPPKEPHNYQRGNPRRNTSRITNACLKRRAKNKAARQSRKKNRR